MNTHEPHRLTTDEERAELLGLARRAIREAIATGDPLAYETDNPYFLKPAAVFVTLRSAPYYYEPEGELRGCVGRTDADAPLYLAVQDAAIKAATIDPRFYPVTPDELDGLSIEISILSPMRPIEHYRDIEVGRDGLLIIGHHRRGLLLPEVPTHFGWDVREFVRQLCRKASLPDDAWPGRAQLLAFTTESFTAPSRSDHSNAEH